MPLFQGLRNGDVDINMEIWLADANTQMWNDALSADEAIDAGKSLDDNWQSTFLIPGYLQDANPGLDSIQDLKTDQYKKIFQILILLIIKYYFAGYTNSNYFSILEDIY